MRKLTHLLLAAAFLLVAGYGSARADEGWVIKSFKSSVTVNPDAKIAVVETIKADFQSAHHGIFRDIPIKYRGRYRERFNFRLSVRSVTDENEVAYKRKVTRPGRNIRIKIGDPDVTLTGEHTYVISYDVIRAIGFLKDVDEIYWNATGTEWPVPIEKAEAVVTLPKPMDQASLRVALYTGPFGSTEKDGRWWFEPPDKVHFVSNHSFGVEEGLTIGVGWPKGIVARPSAALRAQWLFTDNMPFLLPLFAWVLAIWMVVTRGRDPEGRGTIVPQYQPPENMSPAEVGTLVDEKMQIKDLSAMIVDLAVRGYLQIIEEPKQFLTFRKKYSLALKRPDYSDDANLKDFEKKILSALFRAGSKEKVGLDHLPSDFASKAQEARRQVYQALVIARHFDSNPQTVRIHYLVGGAIALVAGFVLAVTTESIAWGAALGGAGLPWLALSWLMPRRTTKGVLAREQILGFKDYLATAEKDRMRFYEQEKIFDKYLPFAMALGVAHLWAKAFEGILKEPRDWYQGSSLGGSFPGFSATDFASGLSSSFSSAMSAASGGSGSGGGGFSGGGGGGGGGGGW